MLLSWIKSVCNISIPYDTNGLCDWLDKQGGETGEEHWLTILIDDGSAIQSALADLTGQSTVPNIFIAKQHIGGNSDLQAKKGDLPNLLKSAGAI